MRKRRIIAMVLVAMMSVSLAAFNQATKPAAKVSTLSMETCELARRCKHSYIVTQYGKWKVVSILATPTSIYSQVTYERTVTEVCTKCGHVREHTERKTFTEGGF